MRTPSHAALCSFLFSTILTSAFVPSTGNVTLAAAGAPAVRMAIQSAMNGIKTQAFAGGAEVSLPALASTPAAAVAGVERSANPGLTPDLLTKLLQLVSIKGKDGEMAPPFANALGMTPVGQAWLNHQVAADGTDQFVHFFAISRGANQDILLYIHRPENVSAYRAGRDGKAISAIDFNLSTKKIAALDAAEAQKNLDAEFAFWSRGIDKLLAGS